MVVDSSVVLALLWGEPFAEWAGRRLNEHRDDLVISAGNLTEVLIRLRARTPDRVEELRERLASHGLRCLPLDERQADIAAQARLRYTRLNLGDCFAYALSVVEDCPILTLDEDFRGVDRPLVMPVQPEPESP